MKNLQKNKVHILAVAITLGLPTTSYADFGLSARIENTKGYLNPKNDAEIFLGLEYRGEKFNMGKSGISYDFTNSNKYAVELLVASKNRGYNSEDSKTFIGMDERKDSIDLGGRLILDTGVGPVVLDVTKDVDSSKGYEAGIKVGGIAPHAPHWTGSRKFNVAFASGVRYQSDDVIDYYYGVKSTEATASRKAYKGKSAVTPYVGIEMQANLTKHISLEGDLNVSRQAKSIINSPITKDRDYQVGASVGISYWF